MEDTPTDGRISSPLSETMHGVGERMLAHELMERLPTHVESLKEEPAMENPEKETRVGTFRLRNSRRAVLADMDYINKFIAAGLPVPSSLEAGPRAMLHFDPATVRAAIVTTGGVAPGLNRMVHAIVSRHYDTYQLSSARGGVVYGVFDGMAGLAEDDVDMIELTPEETRNWQNDGGSFLGSRREFKFDKEEVARRVAANLRKYGIQILYIIGGDGSLTTANEFFPLVRPHTAVIGLPKTMDNDIPWVGQSFGFSTAVHKAAELICEMHTEACSTRRVCVIELFGADSGFVAANAAMASGRAMLVLVPEMFAGFKSNAEIERAFETCLDFLRDKVMHQKRAGGVVVVAEGVRKLFVDRKVKMMGKDVDNDRFVQQVATFLQKDYLFDSRRRKVTTFINRPRHQIRAIAPNAADRTYCERLGAMAVEAGLTGYTGCMVSHWLNEYVLVPLSLACTKRSLALGGLFWKQVVLSTGQPDISPPK
jgi:6-phosphofructokinase 1